ncbi:MAG: tellurite-like stress resistance cysteine protease StiP [Bacillota bacterium]|nr:tellurite-like stress resistance cysteine protease StiP [Bacillota bacterium]
MLKNNTHDEYVRSDMPGVRVYLKNEGLCDPFGKHASFRGEEAFDGLLKGWQRWQKPSPESQADQELNRLIIESMRRNTAQICGLHDRLIEKMMVKVPRGKKILLVAILRAGLFISLGLAKRMAYLSGEDVPVVALGLFHEAGIDRQAFAQICADYPEYYPVFVDGWTGRGVVAAELREDCSRLNDAPDLQGFPLLATLVDPGHYGDLWGTDQDVLLECAHFSAPEVLGFSRAFIKDPGQMWHAYTYPDEYCNHALIEAWLNIFSSENSNLPEDRPCKVQNLDALLNEITLITGTQAGQWKVNINEVARTFVNRKPKQLILGITSAEAECSIPSIVYLAEKYSVPVEFIPQLGEKYNFLAAVRVK